MAYHPTNMTISLLPVISEDGRELHWDHQAASASYVMDLDQVGRQNSSIVKPYAQVAFYLGRSALYTALAVSRAGCITGQSKLALPKP